MRSSQTQLYKTMHMYTKYGGRSYNIHNYIFTRVYHFGQILVLYQ